MDEATRWAGSGEWKSVTSSNVLAIRYDVRGKTLYVRFKGIAKGIARPVYDYVGVPQGVAQAMHDADSKGVFLWENVRNRYPFNGPHG